jgi:hypothetical protein
VYRISALTHSRLARSPASRHSDERISGPSGLAASYGRQEQLCSHEIANDPGASQVYPACVSLVLYHMSGDLRRVAFAVLLGDGPMHQASSQRVEL